MVVISCYQRLNRERAEIIADGLKKSKVSRRVSDVVLNKKESIERCVQQIRAYCNLPGDVPVQHDFLRRDAIALNWQRACQQCIDLANHRIKIRKPGIPKESRESFQLLAEKGILPRDPSGRPEKMVGFRNVLVHQCQELDIEWMIEVVEVHLDDLLEFSNHGVAAAIPNRKRH
ncbi:MAG: type VII toxin-antitoxin system HepT family RNase toxin [Desulfococcaceae bacterium]